MNNLGRKQRKSKLLWKLVDITKESKLLKKIKRIQEELNIMSMVLIEQRRVLEEFFRLIPKPGSRPEESARSALQQIVDTNLRDVEKKDQHAEKVHGAVSIFQITGNRAD